MASILSVEQLQGLVAGSTPNTITIPTGQKIIGTDNASIVAPGHVLQVLQSTFNTENLTSSSSWTNTGFTGTITPTNSTSKVLALCQIPFMSYNNSSNECIGFGRLLRGSSHSGYIVANGYDYGGSGQIINHTAALNWLDSPATTNATTYTFQISHQTGTQTRLCYQNAQAHMILMEIAQ